MVSSCKAIIYDIDPVKCSQSSQARFYLFGRCVTPSPRLTTGGQETEAPRHQGRTSPEALLALFRKLKCNFSNIQDSDMEPLNPKLQTLCPKLNAKC